ncbi:gliding motility-associated-like protein [Flavobacterium sp. 2755]|uniref:HYR domain-containing protein n=1 Tax=Flavobacterium sp. 2755 TaxID=2817765 RepID=UPI0028598ECC|nr:HYR domain-containing protein [Flavobacterium sp. 2755]MDR6764550.1 gliding motility-associated-like protein [Flavobacterium sp. 2755]
MKSNRTILKITPKFQIFLFLFFFAGIWISNGQNGCAQIPVSVLNGSNGFLLEGKANEDDLGYTTKSAGDINHDGIPDIMIGAPGIDFGGMKDVGEIYVIFGGSGFSFKTFDVAALNGTNGFVIRGVAAGEKLGTMLSPAGDFNNDGIDDIIIGNYTEEGMATAQVFFGANTFQPLYNRTDIDNTKGISITCNGEANTYIIDVSYAGDVNHDGISDVVITEFYAARTNNYVVFGAAGITDLVTSSLNGTNGFKISGYPVWYGDSIGHNAGDINNDGIDDLVLGFPSFQDSANPYSGRVVLIFGKNLSFPAIIDLDILNASEGTIITNSIKENRMGKSVASAGDFNNDGIDDIIVGAPFKDLDGVSGVGGAYVVFGRNTFPASFSITSITPATGVVFQGNKYNDQFGFSVAGVKDINHDGKDDIAISSKEGISNSGALYIVFGGNTATGIVKENKILNTVGYQIFDDFVGYSNETFACDAAGIGDFNNDGTNDFILGSIRREDYYWDKGSAYIFYGETLDRIDNVKPIIECPVNQELYVNSTLPNYITLLPNVTDNCLYTSNYDLVITQSPPQGTLFKGDTNVTITVTDLSGNTNSCTFLVKLKTPPSAPTCKTVNFSLEELNGTNGFVVYGETGFIQTGFSVNKAGDINNDGIQDFILSSVGDIRSSSGAFKNAQEIIKGSVYVVYGKTTGFPPTVHLKDLNGTNGFIIRDDVDLNGYNKTGTVVASAGDINGDGIDDLMLSAPHKQNINYDAGAVYVIFGKTGGLAPQFFLSSLNGSNGFVFSGTEYYETIGTGIDPIGDFNNDGFDDIAVFGSGQLKKGHIIYGKSGPFPALLLSTELNGSNGFSISGDPAVDKIANSLTGLGDVNGDGIPDIAVATYDGEKRYIIYGSSGFPSEFNVTTLNGSNGFIVQHSTSSLKYTGINKVGDLNHDGFNDIAFNRDFVLFGSASIPASVDLNNLDGTNGFKLENSFASVGKSGSIGDFNKDGIDDYLFAVNNSGAVIIYGREIWKSSINMFNFTAKDGLRLTFSHGYDTSFNFTGDINNDGFDDIIGSSIMYNSSGSVKINEDPGRVYVIYGKKNITDTEKPVIANCPNNEIIDKGDEIPNYTNNITVTDDCDQNPLIEQSPIPGTIFTGGKQTVTLTVTDASSHFQTCTFTISDGIDNEVPVLTCLGNQQLACGEKVPNYLPLLTVTDDIDTNVQLTQNPPEGTAFYDGMEIVFTAQDDAGHYTNCSIIISATGADTKPPTFTIPLNVTLYCGEFIPNYAFSPIMNLQDNCSDNITAEMTPPVGTRFYDGISIHIKYTDESGNSDACTFVVHSAEQDFTPPLIYNCIGDQTLACGSKIPDYTLLVKATDECDPSPVITQDPAAGSDFTDGMTVTVTATDASNQYSECSFIVSLSADTTPPVITCIGDQNLLVGTSLPDYRSMVTVSDNCDSNLTVTQTPGPGSAISDGMNVVMNTTDNSGNETSCSFVIHIVLDNEVPVFTCLTDQMVECNTTVIPDYTKMISATDNMDPNPSIVQNPAAGSDYLAGMTVKITVSDQSNNSKDCHFQIFTNPIVVEAGNDQQITEGQSVNLEAVTSENGTFLWFPSDGLSNNAIANPIAAPLTTTTYKVVFKNEYNCEAEDFVTITVVPEDKDETKYGFSPNGDGINDYWQIDDITNYPNNQVLIYNRWGDLVFQTENYDNTSNVFTGIANKSRNLGANQLPEGTYFFEIRVNQPHHFKKLKGYLVLKR